MIPQIKVCYPDCDVHGCHQIMKSSFYVKDNAPLMCSITTNSVDATLFVRNNDNVDIDCVCIDSCLITSDEIKKCDLVIISEETIWFIELKEMSYHHSVPNSKDIKRKNYIAKKAVKQLASTIKDFKLKGVNFDNYIVTALISYPPFVNEINPISIPSTAIQARVNEFSRACGYVNLYEGNYIVFS